MSDNVPIVEGRGIVKRYGHVTAIDHSDFELRNDEILGVIGDNGAGKSSIVKAICGAVVPDEGEILIDGKKVNFTSPTQARDMGIEIVYQTLAMSPALSIADNMFMGREIRKSGFMGKIPASARPSGNGKVRARKAHRARVDDRSVNQPDH